MSATRRRRPEPVPDGLLAITASDDEAATSLRGKRLGLPREYFVAGMEPGVEARVREGVAALEAAGAVVEEVSLPHTEYGLATYYIVAPAEASANLARYDGIRYGPRLGEGRDVLGDYLATRGMGFGPEVKRRVMLGTYALSAGYYDAYYLKAQKVRTLIKGDFDALWAQGFDALVAPTSPTVAFRFGARLEDPVAMYLSDACTLPVNMAGLPGISIPAGLSEDLPVGLQLIGAPWSEARLLGLARGYEAITATAGWRTIEPTDLAALDDPTTPTPAQRMSIVGAESDRVVLFGPSDRRRRASSTISSSFSSGCRHGRSPVTAGGPSMEPTVAVLFMSGIILTIVGSSRAIAMRVGRGVIADDHGGTAPVPVRIRPDVARLLWLAVGLYGLFLASAGIIYGR